MKFQVTRTSDFWKVKPPCDGAFAETVIESQRVSRRRHFAQPKSMRDAWHEGGFNYRETGEKNITMWRDVVQHVWVVELDTLEAFITFIETNGECVVSAGDYKELAGRIEIYDDYRE